MPTPILLDTNVLVLVAVGLTNIEYIPKHKRLQAFDEQDFRIVSSLIEQSSGVVFCPNILTETSNLVRYIGDPMRSEIAATLASMTRRTEERFVASSDAMNRPEYNRLGLADAVLLTLAETGATVLTDDLGLYIAATTKGLNAINYNHFRELRTDFR